MQYQTSFIKFYSSMIETPYLGDKYNYFLPGAMLAFSVLFWLMSYLRYESTLVAMMRRINHEDYASVDDLNVAENDEDVTGSMTSASATEVVQDLRVVKKREAMMAKARIEITLLLKGEIASLKEVKLKEDKKQRAKRR